MSAGRPQPVKLLVDEDLSPRVAQRLREEDGIDAVHVRDRGQLGALDHEVLELAFAEDRILATANVRDFGRLASACEVHGGIVLLVEGDLLRDEQLEVLREVVRVIGLELEAGRDMINRALRISIDGTATFEPTGSG